MMTAVQDVSSLSCIGLLEIWEGTIPELEIQESWQVASWQQAPFNPSTNYIGHYHNHKSKGCTLNLHEILCWQNLTTWIQKLRHSCMTGMSMTHDHHIWVISVKQYTQAPTHLTDYRASTWTYCKASLSSSALWFCQDGIWQLCQGPELSSYSLELKNVFQILWPWQ